MKKEKKIQKHSFKLVVLSLGFIGVISIVIIGARISNFLSRAVNATQSGDHSHTKTARIYQMTTFNPRSISIQKQNEYKKR